VRILLVSQFWPGPADPDLGVFLVDVVRELEARGHDVDRVVIDRRGGPKTKYASLAGRAVRQALRRRPDVVFAHFLVPAGLAGAAASLATRTPLVVMAHGQDVRNAASIAPVRAATAATVRRASAVLVNSAYLRDQLVEAVPAAAAKVEIADCGVDLERFAPRDQATAREALGLRDLEGPVFLFAGSLVERKNVVRLRDALRALGRGTLLVVGDGPLRPELEGDPRIHLAGRVPHEAMPEWIAAADVVCLPSLVEPFGQALLEAMAAGRSVVATAVGGPPEFVTPDAGVLVDPLDEASIRAGLERAAALPVPNLAARAAAEPHGVAGQVDRMQRVLLAAAR
jgi:glycosyltransferase involved in cell wall biosynthesis